jgi:hypothetical protein
VQQGGMLPLPPLRFLLLQQVRPGSLGHECRSKALLSALLLPPLLILGHRSSCMSTGHW